MPEQNRIGLGTAAIGRPEYINIKRVRSHAPFSLPDFQRKVRNTLEKAYEKGIRYFDTSPGYGIAESLLINWVQEKNDPEIQVSTKWGYTYVADFETNAAKHEVKEHSLAKLTQQWAVSKQLLPFLKTYQIHSATLESGVLENAEILEFLHWIKNAYKVNIGLSTTGHNQVEVLKEAMKVSIKGEQLFQSFQCTFNILEQGISECKDHLGHLKGPLIIKEVLANGRLFSNDLYPRYGKLYNFMNTLADRYKVGVDAVAIRYCLDCFPNALVLSGTKDSTHLDSNLKASQFKLSIPEIDQLNTFRIDSTDYWNERKHLKWN